MWLVSDKCVANICFGNNQHVDMTVSYPWLRAYTMA